jgi:hypothetical protein
MNLRVNIIFKVGVEITFFAYVIDLISEYN